MFFTVNADLKLPKITEPNKYSIKYTLGLFEIASIESEGKYEILDTVSHIFFTNNFILNSLVHLSKNQKGL